MTLLHRDRRSRYVTKLLIIRRVLHTLLLLIAVLLFIFAVFCVNPLEWFYVWRR